MLCSLIPVWERLSELFHAGKKNTSLSERIHEIIILTVGSVWNSQYELYAHSAVARTIGIPEAVIESIVSGKEPDFNSEQEAIACEFARQLSKKRRVDQETYSRALQFFENKGLVDIVILIGLYMGVR